MQRATRLRNPLESTESGRLVRRVVEQIGKSIEDHLLHPGDRLLSEREMAHQLQVSRATVRDAIGYLAAMGVLKIRQGAGTFVADGPPEIGRLSLGLIGALHGFQPWQMFEARIILERSLAALAAEPGRRHSWLHWPTKSPKCAPVATIRWNFSSTMCAFTAPSHPHPAIRFWPP
jgi:DNA-binding transcriptional MocR family regulator